MPKRILFQFDCDPQPSSFDAVVAIDAGVEHLIPFAGVQATAIESLVHGAMFTRGGDDLRNTAIFIGGSDVSSAEALLRRVTETFFGPVRVSVMLDANGCNTTAAAAVVAAARHVTLAGASAVVLGGTGPVGQRVARLLATDGASVTVTSRSQSRAQTVCDQIAQQLSESDSGPLRAAETAAPGSLRKVLSDAQIVIACGAAGVQLASSDDLRSATDLAVAVDLNAVPPAGLDGVSVTDKAAKIQEHSASVGYGAVGVGGLKMKTHRAAIQSLFESNDKVLDADEIFALAKSVDAKSG
ncbi:bifunctional NADP-dependent methylenetetrahydromethanopterin dehydrogenase/methylenetetrahydrofolate dehydrogenase [Roseiconus nitratireducens]|uniref:Bifunctional NADP-dependent methylenetetrahydromethanopterin dehydrogenase/methylenetetrahydrofolate dehydrogenase n=1 Tax=Roseiconus nitratireducens TaxID=2605748 RepID=A0A5M6DH83_9BACT|nr:NAD(P)-dependent methylenetetrahydromethanopterin dehydrogenase [Roseiconus nitratireducens]KAA5546918.1 bifunctional NADP-dependent methylenetetrahydromethanopterin dehydrogenase/methylenetetrahydrofolate dehydrogenase [Roseiconus nitratireducens]